MPIGRNEVEMLVPNRNTIDAVLERICDGASGFARANGCRRRRSAMVATRLIPFYDVEHIITQLYPHPDVNKSRQGLLISA